MSFPNEYSKDMFKQDLDNGSSFKFKGKTWILVFLWLVNIIIITVGISLIVLLIPQGSFYALLTGIFFIIIIIGGIISGLKAIGRMIEITPEGISWKGGLSSGYINFIDIEDISYFPSPILDFHTVKLFLSNNRKVKLRTSNMTKPKNWYSEEMIRTVIDSYWTKSNPKAKYSTESISSKPTPKPKSISLIKPGVSKQESETSKGYKCPNCLFIHKKGYNFCPKCGAEM
ncbi:MAG: zinc ribbon domain-containing protein [Promethearchaeota archaeon]